MAGRSVAPWSGGLSEGTAKAEMRDHHRSRGQEPPPVTPHPASAVRARGCRGRRFFVSFLEREMNERLREAVDFLRENAGEDQGTLVELLRDDGFDGNEIMLALAEAKKEN